MMNQQRARYHSLLIASLSLASVRPFLYYNISLTLLCPLHIVKYK